MGYILAPRCWGQGLMTEAVRGALEYGFTRLGVDRVELWIDARNLASQGVAARTGFKRRGVFRHKYAHEPASHEMLVYGLRIDEWRAGSTVSDPRRSRPTACSRFSPCPTSRRQRSTTATSSASRSASSTAIRRPMAAVALSEWTATGASIHLSKADAASPAGIALYLNVGPGLGSALRDLPRPRRRSRRRGRAAALGRARVRAARLQRLSAAVLDACVTAIAGPCRRSRAPEGRRAANPASCPPPSSRGRWPRRAPCRACRHGTCDRRPTRARHRCGAPAP